ncbi:gamma-glutamylcyclotransferase [Leucothrix pacifica]|uniref:Gamma-glutamylcyclotransferase n=1 Tax=Leucothrix pacifica TaxID=1247513 RepID=A0A317CLK1_9GAMM|nr:gamma-glutamylcyclotransferase [Leucothrix pacifica]PWQ99474.1 gamma-glutamylcyclotransferase [Leucothrix pacifica]
MACFFGFGSLVNTATHRYQPVTAAKVDGWRRIWVNNKCYEHAFLSVEPDESSAIQGLMAQVPEDDWQELDTREVGYLRRVLTPQEWMTQAHCSDAPAALITSAPTNDTQMYVLQNGEYAQAAKPILWSYLETVLFGYYQWFGPEGVDNFIQSTGAWTSVLDDRSQPIYPRYVPAEGDAAEIIAHKISNLSQTV